MFPAAARFAHRFRARELSLDGVRPGRRQRQERQLTPYATMRAIQWDSAISVLSNSAGAQFKQCTGARLRFHARSRTASWSANSLPHLRECGAQIPPPVESEERRIRRCWYGSECGCVRERSQAQVSEFQFMRNPEQVKLVDQRTLRPWRKSKERRGGATAPTAVTLRLIQKVGECPASPSSCI